jgi:hypothetical protein
VLVDCHSNLNFGMAASSKVPIVCECRNVRIDKCHVWDVIYRVLFFLTNMFLVTVSTPMLVLVVGLVR